VNEQLRRLRDAVTGRDREVEVAADGSVREVGEQPAAESQPEKGKATKLAPRTFGA
jgi:hypothetical protein